MFFLGDATAGSTWSSILTFAVSVENQYILAAVNRHFSLALKAPVVWELWPDFFSTWCCSSYKKFSNTGNNQKWVNWRWSIRSNRWFICLSSLFSSFTVVYLDTFFSLSNFPTRIGHCRRIFWEGEVCEKAHMFGKYLEDPGMVITRGWETTVILFFGSMGASDQFRVEFWTSSTVRDKRSIFCSVSSQLGGGEMIQVD